MRECGLVSAGSVTASREHGTELSGSMQRGEHTDELSGCQLQEGVV
jgi:hypothetical protein